MAREKCKNMLNPNDREDASLYPTSMIVAPMEVDCRIWKGEHQQQLKVKLVGSESLLFDPSFVLPLAMATSVQEQARTMCDLAS
jgi:hypothetical protein